MFSLRLMLNDKRKDVLIKTTKASFSSGVKKNKCVGAVQMELLDQHLKNIEKREAMFNLRVVYQINLGVVYQSLSSSPF